MKSQNNWKTQRELKAQAPNTIKATPNHSARTFTLRKSNGSKYRTLPMQYGEFKSCLNNTSSDWMRFLTTCDDYTVLK
jgi:hypothetical protein